MTPDLPLTPDLLAAPDLPATPVSPAAPVSPATPGPRAPHGPPSAGEWVEDVLGPDFHALTLTLDPDDEGDVVATLVRYSPPVPEPQRATLQRRLFSDLRAECAEGGDELTCYALVGAENLGRDVSLPPIEPAFADQPERVGEIVERSPEFADRKE